MKKDYLNEVYLKGKIHKPQWSFTDNDGIMHYSAVMEIKRPDSITDYLPIYLTKDMIKDITHQKNFVEIIGSIKIKRIRKKEIIFVSAKKLTLLTSKEYQNLVVLQGCFSKKTSNYKKKKAFWINYYINFDQSTKKSIPVFAWKNTADSISSTPFGTTVFLKGRLQNTKLFKSFDIDTISSKPSTKINTLFFERKN